MSGFENIIGDLLLRHNCVIIPSFGGFVAKPVSARIDYTKGLITPPGKSLLFNKQLVNNDGLLISELALRSSESYASAERVVDSVVAGWNADLKNGKRIEIERVGILFRDEENNICFEQDRFFNLLLESYGLGKVHFVSAANLKVVKGKEEKPKERTKIIAFDPLPEEITGSEEMVSVMDSEKGVHPDLTPARKRTAWKYIAAACMMPILFYTIWIPVKTDVLESGVISIKDFNPFYNTSEGSYVEKPLEGTQSEETEKVKPLKEELEELENEFYTYRIDGTHFVPVKLNSDNTAETQTPETHAVLPDAMNFIVGCFGNKSNADNLVEDLKSQGFNARVVDIHNGLHRVSAGQALSLEALAEIRTKAESKGFKGWVLK